MSYLTGWKNYTGEGAKPPYILNHGTEVPPTPWFLYHYLKIIVIPYPNCAPMPPHATLDLPY